jgi:hypothetical protein
MGVGLLAGSASAAGPLNRTFHAPPEQVRRSFDIRPVSPPAIGLAPIRQPGMFAETNVAPNMRLGLGLFGARRGDVGAFEPGAGSRAKPKRKLGLSFSWRF